MLRYKLNTLAERRPGTTVSLPMITGTLGRETEYLRALRVMLRALASSVSADVMPVVEREIAMQRRLTQDMDDDVFRRLGEFASALANIAAATVSRILGLEAKRHTKTFMATAKRTLGVDLAAVVRDEDLEEYLATAATRNAGLIKGLSQLAVQRIQTTVTTAVLTGTPAAALKKKLKADFDFADSRARLIARDQIAKLTSDLNRFRHQQAGIVKYTWRTSHDERVRALHRRLEGRLYAYGEPTDAEDGLPPGQPINCRCIAQAIVEF